MLQDRLEQSLSGKTAVVLGASGEYGSSIARSLSRAGMNLVLGARSRNRLEALQQELGEAGANATVIGTDVTRPYHLQRLVEESVAVFGSLDVLVYAAYSPVSPADDWDLQTWEQAVDVNFKGFLYSLGLVIPLMQEQREGRVVYLGCEEPCNPILRSTQAAAQTFLDDLSTELYGTDVRLSQLLLQPLPGATPAQCVSTVLQALCTDPETSDGLSTHYVSG